MKNVVKWFGLIAIVAIIGFTVIACSGSKPSGTYVHESGMASVTFSGNKVTMDQGRGYKVEGTYKIQGGKIFLTSPDGDTEELDYSLQGNTLTIFGEVFTKK